MSQRKSQARTRAEDRILHITSGTGTGRHRTPRQDGPSDVYRQLLSEASDPSKHDGPPQKRRRVGAGHRPNKLPDNAHVIDLESFPQGGGTASNPQTVVDSDESDESDFDWEQVPVDGRSGPAESDGTDGPADILLEVSANNTPKKSKRRAATAEERALALNVHKTHVLFLLFHAHVRNSWCNLTVVENRLKSILFAKIIHMLHPDSSWIQLRQSDSFLDGLRAAASLWQSKFRVSASGLKKAKWAESDDELVRMRERIHEVHESLTKDDFIAATKTLRGSQDVGNQLFCALLRSVGVEARLVCSLQPLAHSITSPKPVTPQKVKPQKPRIYATFESDQDTASSADETGPLNLPQRPQRRLGQQNTGGPVGNYQHAPQTPPKKKVQRLDYPVFWVEALNPAYQKWVAIDPIVTETISRPAKLEPPLIYDSNVMTYVVAFDEDGHARDVTRRYAKAYNAKTRRQRVESLPKGQEWYNNALKPFRRRVPLDRDQIEDAELDRKEGQEGLPNNIQDFKDHPNYALERHLRRNEVIWPRREVGKVNAGKSSVSNLEPIFRRGDVQIVQSADKWYRLGRDVKQGQQPLKHVPARKRQKSLEDSDLDEPETTALYSFSQTELFMPPSVVKGRIPKNVYGNIDVYVPSMVPPGGAHIKHPLAKRAAQLLGIDFADAVTGFQFKGRHGTAVIQGIIMALEFREAVQLTIEGFEEVVKGNEDEIRSMECLRLWRRFFLGLQIAKRIGLTDIYAANDKQANALREELDDAEVEAEETQDAGGFLPEQDDTRQVPRMPTRVQPKGSELAIRNGAEENLPQDLPSGAQRRRKRRMVNVDSEDDDADTYDPTKVHHDMSDMPRQDTQPATQTYNAIGQDMDMDGTPMPVNTHESASMQVYGNQTEHHDIQHTSSDAGGGFMVDEASGGFVVEDEGGGFEVTEQEGGFMTEEAHDPRQAQSVALHDQELSDDQTGEDQVDEVEDEDEDDEGGSMLSHDPEDDDADPEWVE